MVDRKLLFCKHVQVERQVKLRGSDNPIHFPSLKYSLHSAADQRKLLCEETKDEQHN